MPINFKREDPGNNYQTDCVFTNKRTISPEQLRSIIERIYNVKFQEEIENYGFLTYSRQKYPYELIFGLKHFEEDLLINKWRENKTNKYDDLILVNLDMYGDLANGTVLNNMKKELDNLKKNEKSESFTLKRVENLLRNTTNFYEIENDQQVELQFKDIYLLIYFFSKNRIVAKSGDIIKILDPMIECIKDFRKSVPTRCTEDKRALKKPNETAMNNKFNNIMNLVINGEYKGNGFYKNDYEQFDTYLPEKTPIDGCKKTKPTKNDNFDGEIEEERSCCCKCCK